MKAIWILLVVAGLGQPVAAQNKPALLQQPAPPIELAQPDGKLLKLSAYKGALVLVDFWATWCDPCVKEQPALKAIYDQYRDWVKAGRFQILGISLDRKKEAWTKGISDLGITWPQASDLKYWSSPVAQQYQIDELPYNVLVDEQGRIIAVNLHGSELATFIGNHLKRSAARPAP